MPVRRARIATCYLLPFFQLSSKVLQSLQLLPLGREKKLSLIVTVVYHSARRMKFYPGHGIFCAARSFLFLFFISQEHARYASVISFRKSLLQMLPLIWTLIFDGRCIFFCVCDLFRHAEILVCSLGQKP